MPLAAKRGRSTERPYGLAGGAEPRDGCRQSRTEQASSDNPYRVDKPQIDTFAHDLVQAYYMIIAHALMPELSVCAYSRAPGHQIRYSTNTPLTYCDKFWYRMYMRYSSLRMQMAIHVVFKRMSDRGTKSIKSTSPTSLSGRWQARN